MRQNKHDRMGYTRADDRLDFLCKLSDNEPFISKSQSSIASNEAIQINSFSEFMTRMAYLSQSNPSLKLLYRGQKSDHQCLNSDPRSFGSKNQTGLKSSLFPTLAREIFDLSTGELKDSLKISLDNIGEISIDNFLNIVQKNACEELFFDTSLNNEIGFWNSQDELQQLAVLQHYEVIPTLMFDLSSDINTALSFGYNNVENKSYFYVFGIPYRGEALSVFPDEELLVIDLARLLPPEALRPHFQCGFMITTHPAIYKNIEGIIHSFHEPHRFPLISVHPEISRILI